MVTEYNYHTNIMGCDFDMTFITDSEEEADRCFTKAVAIADLYEKKFSRFDKNSELFQLNKYKTLVVSQIFLDVFFIAKELYIKTQKKFNPLLQVSKIGYNKSFNKLNKNQICNFDCKSYNIDLEKIVVINNKIILQENQKLDFGGFLKGFVVQKIVNEIKNDRGSIINIGGDLCVNGLDCNHIPFEIEIINPCDKLKNIKIPLLDKVLCTSGIYKRTWKYNKKLKHHILDANYMDSADTDIVSVSVITDNGAIADTFATLAVTLGSKKSIDFFKLQNVDYVIICKNGDIIISNNIKQ